MSTQCCEVASTAACLLLVSKMKVMRRLSTLCGPHASTCCVHNTADRVAVLCTGRTLSSQPQAQGNDAMPSITLLSGCLSGNQLTAACC